MIQTQWLKFPKLMREIPSMSLKTSSTFKRSIYILYLESRVLCGSFVACSAHYKCRNLVFTIKYLFHILPCPFIVPLQKCHCQCVLIIIRNQHVKAQLNRTWIFKGDLQVFLHMLCWNGWVRDIFTFSSFQLSPVVLQLLTRRTSRNADSAPEAALSTSAYP